MISRCLHGLFAFSVCMSLLSVASSVRADDDVKSQLPVHSSTTQPINETEYRILFVGDSITAHGTNAEIAAALGWDHSAGMAASSEDKDYVHLFAARIQARMPDKKVRILISGPGNEGPPPAERMKPILEAKALKPHLIVYQHGEHEAEARGEKTMREMFELMVTAFDDQHPRPQQICVGVWAPSLPLKAYTGWSKTVNTAMQEICTRHKIPFISIEKAALDPACSGTGKSFGLKWHPNDLGHQRYAEGLCKAYLTLVPPVAATRAAVQP